MGDTQSAERDVNEDATTDEESAHVDIVPRAEIAEGKPFHNNAQIAVLTGKAEDPIAGVNDHFEDDVVADAHGKSPAIVTPEEESLEIEKPLKDDKTLETVEINIKKTPDAEPEPTKVTETEATLNEINDGFKTFLKNFGLKLTVKRNSDAKSETSDLTDVRYDAPVDSMEGEPSSPDNARETTDDTTSENVEHSADLNTAQETLDNDTTSCPTMTDITSEDIQEKAEGKKAEATEVTEQVHLDDGVEEGEGSISKEETTVGVYTAPEKEGAMSQISPDEEVIYLVKKFFTTGIFSGLRKKKHYKHSNMENSKDETIDKELAKYKDDQTEHDQEQTRHKVYQSVPTAADFKDEKENATSKNAFYITVKQHEHLRSQEKVKVQGSPLKKMLSGSSFKKQPQMKSSESKLSDSCENLVVNVSEELMSSTESTEGQREHSPAEWQANQELTQEEEGAWASFKKLVTPKRHMKKSSLTNEDPIIVGTLVEPKPIEEEQITDGSTEETKRRKDSTVSWEALLCRSGRRKSGKTSDSDDDNQNEGDDYRTNRESRHAAESPLECSHEGDGHLTEEISEVDRGSTWKSFKKLVTPKRKAKGEESKDQVISDGEINKDDDSCSIKKLLPGRKKRRSAEKQDQVSSDEADRSVESDEDSETPAVVPLYEFDEPVDQIQTQVVIEYPINPEDHEAQRDHSKQITELDLPNKAEVKLVQDSNALKHMASSIPASNDAVEDTTEFISKHQQLSDIPEEGIIEESMATPGSAHEAAIRDDTIADDLIELTSEAVTAPEPLDITLADETEMISAVSQLTDSSKTSGNTTPVPGEYEVKEIEECLHKVAISVTLIAATTTTGLNIAASSSPQILVTSTKKKETILELHNDSETTAISIGLSAKEFETTDKIAVTPKTEECLSENTDAISSEQVSEDTTEFYTAGIVVNEVHQADISPIEECIADHRHLEANICKIIEDSTDVDTTEVEAVTVKSDEGSAEILVIPAIEIYMDIPAIEIDIAIGSIIEEPTQDAHQTEASFTEEKEDAPLDVETDAKVEHVLMTEPSVSSVTDSIYKMVVQPCASVDTFIENAGDSISQEFEQQVTCAHTSHDANNAIAPTVNEVIKHCVTLTEQGLVEREGNSIENDPHDVCQNALLEKDRKLSEVSDEAQLTTIEDDPNEVPKHTAVMRGGETPEMTEALTAVHVASLTVTEGEKHELEEHLTSEHISLSDTEYAIVSFTNEKDTQIFDIENVILVMDDVEKEGLKLTDQVYVERKPIKKTEPQERPLNVVVEEEGKLSEVAGDLKVLMAAPVASIHAETNVEVFEEQNISFTNELQDILIAHRATDFYETSSALVTDKQAISESIPVPDDKHSIASVTAEGAIICSILIEQTAVEKELTTTEDDPSEVPQHAAVMEGEQTPKVTEALPALTAVHISLTGTEGEKHELEEHIPFPDTEYATGLVTNKKDIPVIDNENVALVKDYVENEAFILIEQALVAKEQIQEIDPQEVPLNVVVEEEGLVLEVADDLEVLVATPVASVHSESNVDVSEKQIISENIPVTDTVNDVALVTNDVEKKSIICTEHCQDVDQNVKLKELKEMSHEKQLLVATPLASVHCERNFEIIEEQNIYENIPGADTENVIPSVMDHVEKQTVTLTEHALVEREDSAIENIIPQHIADVDEGQITEVTNKLQDLTIAHIATEMAETCSSVVTKKSVKSEDIAVHNEECLSASDEDAMEIDIFIEQTAVEIDLTTIKNDPSEVPQHTAVIKGGETHEVTEALPTLTAVHVSMTDTEGKARLVEKHITSEHIPFPNTGYGTGSDTNVKDIPVHDAKTFVTFVKDVEKEALILTEQDQVEKEHIQDIDLQEVPLNVVVKEEGKLSEVADEMQVLVAAPVPCVHAETNVEDLEEQILSENIPVVNTENVATSVIDYFEKESIMLTEHILMEKEDFTTTVHDVSLTDTEGEERDLEEHLKSEHIPFPDTEYAIVLKKVLVEVGKLSEVADELQVLVAGETPEVTLPALSAVHVSLTDMEREAQLLEEHLSEQMPFPNTDYATGSVTNEKNSPVLDTENAVTLVKEDVVKEALILTEQALVEKEHVQKNDLEEVPQNDAVEEEGQLTIMADQLQILVAALVESEHSETNGEVIKEQIISENIPVTEIANVTLVKDDVEEQTVILTEGALMETDFTIDNTMYQQMLALDKGQVTEVSNELQGFMMAHITDIYETGSALVTEKQAIFECFPVSYQDICTASAINETAIFTEQASEQKEATTIEDDPGEVPQHTAVMKVKLTPDVTEALPALTDVHVASLKDMEGEEYALEEHLTSEHIPFSDTEYAIGSVTDEKDIPIADIEMYTLVKDDIEKEALILSEQALVEKEHIQEIAPQDQHDAIMKEEQTPEVIKALTSFHEVSLTSEKGQAQVVEEHSPTPHTQKETASVTEVTEVEKEVVTLTEQAVVEIEQKSIENDCNNVAQHIVISDEGQIAAVHIASLEESSAQTLGNSIATAADKVNVEGEKELTGVNIEAVKVEQQRKVITSNAKYIMASMPDASIVEISDIPEPSTDVTEEEYRDVDTVRTLPLTVEENMIKTADTENVVVMHMTSIQWKDDHSVKVVDPNIKSPTALRGVADAKEFTDICHLMDNKVENLSANMETEEQITEEANQVLLHNVTQHERANLPDIQGVEDPLHNKSSAILDESVAAASSEMPDSEQCKVHEVQQVTGILLETCIETKAQGPSSAEPAIATEQEKGENEMPHISEVVEDVTIQVSKEDQEEIKTELKNGLNLHLLLEELTSSYEEAVMQNHVEQKLQTNSCQVITHSNSDSTVPQNTGLISSVGNVESPSSLSIEFRRFGQTKALDTLSHLVEKTEPIKLTDVSDIGVRVTERLESIREPDAILSVESSLKQMSEVEIQVTEKTKPIKDPESPKCLKQTHFSEAGIQVTESVHLVRQTEITEIAICQNYAELSEVAIQVTEIIAPATQLESTKLDVILGQTALIEAGTKPIESAQQTESFSKPVSESGAQVTETIQPETQMKITEKEIVSTETFRDLYKEVCVGTRVLQVQREEEYDHELRLDAEETVCIQEMNETVESLEGMEENNQGEGISSHDVAQMEDAKNLEETLRIEGTDTILSEGDGFAVALGHSDMNILTETSITSVEWDSNHRY